jgi:Transposase DDE domain
VFKYVTFFRVACTALPSRPEDLCVRQRSVTAIPRNALVRSGPRSLDCYVGCSSPGRIADTVTRPPLRSKVQTSVPPGSASSAFATPSGMVVLTEEDPGCVCWIDDLKVPGKGRPDSSTADGGLNCCQSVGCRVANGLMYPRGVRLLVANTWGSKRWRQMRLSGLGNPGGSVANFHHRLDPRLPAAARARGLAIAAQPRRVVQVDGGAFLVIADASRKKELVSRVGDFWGCTCDIAKIIVNGQCEHVWAVRYTVGKPRKGEAIIEIQGTVDDRSDWWRAYTEGQKAEGRLFDEFLAALLTTVEEPPRPEGRAGRPRLPLREGLFCTIKKVSQGKSCRRSYSEMEEDATEGRIGHLPNWSVSSRVLGRPDITPLLLDLVTFSATPLIEVERGGTIAIDSTGFAAHWFGGYFLEAHDVDRAHDWVKGHLAIGTRTHVVTAARVNERGGDAPELPGLLRQTLGAGFEPSTVVADRGYTSHANYAAADQLGLKAYFPFKSNSRPNPKGVKVWRDMYHLFALHDGQFDGPYHRRSQVESVNSALKRKMGEPLFSKGTVARRNEVLSKILGYNITILIGQVFQTGVDPLTFFENADGPGDTPASINQAIGSETNSCESISQSVKESVGS